MRLSELKTGESATIVKVMGHGGFRRRIMEMGFVRGQRVEVILNAPLKDPIEYKIMGYDISLRRSEADMVVVLTDDEAGEYLARRKHSLRQLIVNVLIFHALGIEPVIDPADTVLENFPVRDGLLCGLRPGLSCRGLLLGGTVRTLSFCARPCCLCVGLQSGVPPFCSEKRKNYRFYRA